MRINRIIDPILYQPAFSRDHHRLIKWRVHWLPSYPLKDCCCGYKEARREHFAICSLLQPLLQDLLNKFGTIPELPFNMQQLDHILNSLPKSEVGLVLGKWKTVWPALIRVIREIDILSYPQKIFEDDEPAPEEALGLSISPITLPDWIISNITASLFHNTYSTFNLLYFIYFFSSYLNPPHSLSNTN